RNLPIAKLLHDAPARELPAYVSGLRRPTAAEQAERARELVAQGYGAFKLFVGHGVEADLATAGAIREAVGSTPLFADALWRYSRDEARELARGLAALRFDWLEAPLAPDDLDGHRELQQSGVLPIAAGETF